MTTKNYFFNINELNDEEQKKFDSVYNDLKSRRQSYLEFKHGLQLKNKLDDEEEENEWRFELYRFLRARKWNTTHTIKSILEMIQWRIDNRVDLILEDQSAKYRMELYQKMAPSTYHGRTKAHLPLYIEKTGQIDVDEMLNKFTNEEFIQCHIYWLEYNCQLAREHGRQFGQHIESIACIYDLNGMKMDVRKLLNPGKQCLYIDDNYYPERLGQLIVLNPPTIFPALWNLVKHFIDPVTKKKIMILKKGNEKATTLLQYIDSDQLPSEYGGSCHSCTTSPDCIPIHNQTNK
ncbi:unnamed protein product [Adineta steineri]|uniref:CRAL-TRIO domain-containing protein n=2 Tax=Adineta steineri TaxID=433720 RepID=A0A819PU07_9BILA|nr:unnamed protein product [Adineta steineri]CAF4020725.1 unnamed protein product [Adineta steineri]